MSKDSLFPEFIGSIISAPYDLSLLYPLYQYQFKRTIRVEQIPTRMYVSFVITLIIVSTRNFIFFHDNNKIEVAKQVS